jgi:hypothetical protein
MRSVTWKAVVLALAAAAAGCSSSGRGSGDGSVGRVGMNFSLPAGLELDQVNYTITGPNTYSGTLNVQNATVIELGVSNIAPGTGYVLSESAKTPDSAVTCSGSSAPFSVGAGETTFVTVALVCTASADAGVVVGTTVASECATWTSAIATPSETTVGSTAKLSATATAPAPTALTFSWTASAGAIDTPSAATANFTCPSTPGPVTITLTVGDGPIPDGGICPASDTTTTLTVTCDPLPVVDAGPPDVGPPPPTPCTTPGQTGCVACSGNAGGACSQTEALVIQHDINAGHAATTPCYACLLSAGCIDDTTFGDKGNECDDLSGTFGGGAATSSSLCLSTVSCIFGSSCAASAVSTCYCGSFAGSACLSAPTVDGACDQSEVTGLGLTSAQDILKNFTNTTLPSGMANQLFQCALSNTCAACLN